MNREFRLLSRTRGTVLACALLLMADVSIGTALGAGSLSADHVAVSLQKLDATAGCGIAAVPGGAKLNAIFQDLEAEATNEGLWITSTADEDAGKKGNRFMVRAEGLGREIIEPLPLHGRVEVSDRVVAWVRPMIVEEYRVGIEGVRQDFVLRERPRHDGELSVALKLHGASAEPANYGAKLTVKATGRELAYHRLLVTDASGRQLAARMEVENSEKLVIRVDDSHAIYPVRVDPTFSDADWISLNTGGIPGVNGSVNALAIDESGSLYAGGSFTGAGTVPASNVACWNGNQWTNLGQGVNGTVRAMAIATNRNLYVAGDFTNAGGVSANRVAVWNGASWSALGAGLTGSGYALAVNDGDAVYVGGTFTNAGGIPANNIAQWNGTNWSALGSGVVGPVSPPLFMMTGVRAIGLAGDGVLYAGGTFTNAGGVGATNVARWNGTNWSAMGSGITISPSRIAFGSFVVTTLAVSQSGMVYAGGAFTNAGGMSASNIARWDGTNWSPLGSGLGSAWPGMGAFSIALDSNGDVYAGGLFFVDAPDGEIARWDGTNWSALDTGVNGPVAALIFESGELFAGGTFNEAGGVAASRVARWDGSSWSRLGPDGMNGSVNAFAVDGSGQFYVGGSFTRLPGGISANRIARWDGNAWTNLGMGLSGSVYDLLASGGALYVGGFFTSAGGITANNVARWNGLEWSVLGTGVGSGVFALAKDSSGKVYAGGTFTNAGGVGASRVARWDGTNWSSLGTGVNSDVESVVVDAGNNVYVGGSFTNAGGTAASRIARWDGTNWSALGSGVNSSVKAIALDRSGNIYAGGFFTNAGGNGANRVARWNGATWSPLGAGMDSRVDVLAIDGRNNLYAGGAFTGAGGASANRVAVWNGSDWSPLGSGVNNSVSSLFVDEGSLFVGGEFSVAGTQWSPFMAVADVSSLSMTALERWRRSWFGTTNNSGDAADGFDFDSDGMVNVMEWAFGLNPTVPQASPLSGRRTPGTFQLNYRRSVSSVDAGAQFFVEWRDDAAEGGWSTNGVSQTVVFDDGSTQTVEASIPMDGALQRFGRLSILSPQ